MLIFNMFAHTQTSGLVSHTSFAVRTIAVCQAAGSVTTTMTAGTTLMKTTVVGPRLCFLSVGSNTASNSCNHSLTAIYSIVGALLSADCLNKAAGYSGKQCITCHCVCLFNLLNCTAWLRFDFFYVL